MADVLNYLKVTKNTLIGNPTAKIELHRSAEPDGPLLATIVGYLSWDSPKEDLRESVTRSLEDTIIRIRIEAANIIASLAHGPREVLSGLLEVNAVSAVLRAVEELAPDDPDSLKVAVLRALRALCVAVADCAGTSLWGIGDEWVALRSESRSVLDYIFQSESQALDTILPYLESSSSQAKLAVAQLLGFAVRVPKHRLVVTDWLPPEDRTKEHKGKRGWEVSALVNVNAPTRLGGWVVRHLSGMLSSSEFKLQETALYAIAALVKDNADISRILSNPPLEGKGSLSVPPFIRLAEVIQPAQSVLSTAANLTKDRKSEVKLAACLCATNILRSPQPVHSRPTANPNRPLSNTIIHVLSSIFSHPYEALVNRIKACHILTSLVIDDSDRCNDAVKAGALTKLSDVIKTITPAVVPQEWEDGEAVDIARLREAALTAVAALSLLDEGIRDEVTRSLCLLPVISICMKHPQPRVRYGACLCIRSLARSVRVLRTSILDSGVGYGLCNIIEKPDEDLRVQSMALAGLCNLLNDFSPLRKTIMDRENYKMIRRIAELARSHEDTIRVSSFWAIKNLLNKAHVSEKRLIMNLVGWEYLKTSLQDSDEGVQEQAFNCITNIAFNSQEHIDLLFDNLQGDELMVVFADALDPAKENVLCQAIYALANIANGATAHRMYIIRNERVLANLRVAMINNRVDVRRAAVSCVESLAKGRHSQLRIAGIEDTLKSITRGTMPSGLSGALSSSPSSRVEMGIETVSEIRELARNALRYLESRE